MKTIWPKPSISLKSCATLVGEKYSRLRFTSSAFANNALIAQAALAMYSKCLAYPHKHLDSK